MSKQGMATQKQRSDATKALLLDAFRSAALELGYAATTTQLILNRTGLSKGAMYHQFRSKAELMAALYRQESEDAFKRAQVRSSAGADGSPTDNLKSLYLAWMEEVLTPSVSKILFEVGPSALGPQRAKGIENEVTLKHIENMLREAEKSGDIRPESTKLIAAMLNALVGEAALFRLRTGEETTQTLAATLGVILESLRIKSC